MAKRMVVMLILVALVFGGIFGFGLFKSHMMAKYMASMGGQVQTVSTAVASSAKWNDMLDVVGSFRAAKGVDLSAEVSGIVDEIHFESGDTVKQGDLLVKLRAADDEAKFNSLVAAANLAETNYKRDVKQLATHAVSAATVETDAATLKIAQAQAVEQQALVEKKSIRAPFAGTLGVRAVDLGQYLNPGTAIVTLQQTDPIYFDFFVPQQALAQLRVGQPISVRNDTYPGQDFAGKISAISPKVDVATRNVQVRAELANADHKLLPGMYATGKIAVGAPKQYITLPQTAVTYNPYGDTVFLVESKGEDKNAVAAGDRKNTKGAEGNAKGAAKGVQGAAQLIARQAFVTLGPTRGDQVAVLKGVKEGETVVTAGQNKLHNNDAVAINNTITPSSDPSPTPQEQ